MDYDIGIVRRRTIISPDDCYFAVPPVVVGGATAFDPANKSANITLSGGNLVSTAGGGAAAGTNVRDTVSHATGKYYAELTITTAGASPVIGIGLVNGTFSIGTDTMGGANNNSIAWYGSDGHVYINSTQQVTQTGAVIVVTTLSQGDVAQLAVDIGAKLLWVRKNGSGFWNVDSAADPTTGANGVSFSVLGSVAMFAAIEEETSGQVVTANFGATAYSFTVPTGYGNW